MTRLNKKLTFDFRIFILKLSTHPRRLNIAKTKAERFAGVFETPQLRSRYLAIKSCGVSSNPAGFDNKNLRGLMKPRNFLYRNNEISAAGFQKPRKTLITN